MKSYEKALKVMDCFSPQEGYEEAIEEYTDGEVTFIEDVWHHNDYYGEKLHEKYGDELYTMLNLRCGAKYDTFVCPLWQDTEEECSWCGKDMYDYSYPCSYVSCELSTLMECALFGGKEAVKEYAKDNNIDERIVNDIISEYDYYDPAKDIKKTKAYKKWVGDKEIARRWAKLRKSLKSDNILIGIIDDEIELRFMKIRTYDDIYGKRNINNNTLHFCAVGVRDIRDSRGILGRNTKCWSASWDLERILWDTNCKKIEWDIELLENLEELYDHPK